MKIIGIHKETKEKVWFDTNWIRLVCEYREERDYKMFGIGNQFQIDPSDHDWTIENIEDNECVDFLLKSKQIANNVHLICAMEIDDSPSDYGYEGDG